MADIYISSAATAPSGGDGSFGNPYALSELSIVGGATKTVSGGDRVLAIADGTYTMPADLALPVAAAVGTPTTLRGVKSSDGTVDDTGATRAVFSMGSYAVAQAASYWLLADLELTDPSTPPVAPTGTGDYGSIWNVRFTVGTGSAQYCCNLGNGTIYFQAHHCSAEGMNSFCRTIGNPNTIRLIGNSHMNAVGPLFDDATSTVIMLIIIGNVCEGIGSGSANGIYVQGALTYADIRHNTIANMGSHGMNLSPSSTATQLHINGNIFSGNGGYGVTFGANVRATSCTDNVAYNNTSGAASVNGSAQCQIGSLSSHDTTDPNYTSATDLTPQATTLPALGDRMYGVGTQRNLAGALTNAGSASPGGGSLLVHPSMTGGMRG